MQIERSDVGSVTVLRLSGDINENGIDELRTAFVECLNAKRVKLVMNLNEVRFVSYMGLGVIVERLRTIRAHHGDIKLVGINLYMERLFRMVGVTGLFDTFDSEGQALGVFKEAA